MSENQTKSVLKSAYFRHETHPSINIKEDQPIDAKEFYSFSSYTAQRKKQKLKDHKDVRKPSGKYGKFTKNEFVDRYSILDFDGNSSINRSPFRGLQRLIYIVGFIYALNLCLKAHRNGESWDDMNVWNLYRSQIKYTLTTWAQFVAFTHLSFIVQKLIILGVVPLAIEMPLNYIIEMGYLWGGSYYIMVSDVYITTRLVIFFIFVSLYFKMNSYSKTNRLYREGEQEESEEVKYPDNVNLGDFWMYLAHPVFVYQANYPLSKSGPSFLYIAKKLGTVFVNIFIIYVTWKERWVPAIEAMGHSQDFLVYTSLFLPGIVVYYFNFIVAFENATNIYAELSGWVDRQFYQDFWNSTNFDEYSRKWNKLVHEFLFRHYFLEYLIRYKLTVFQAMLWTFTFSTIFHELFFIAVFRSCTGYLSALQLAQLIYTMIFKYSGVAGTIMGNFIFHWGFMIGVVSTLYLYMSDFYNLTYMEDFQ